MRSTRILFVREKRHARRLIEFLSRTSTPVSARGQQVALRRVDPETKIGFLHRLRVEYRVPLVTGVVRAGNGSEPCFHKDIALPPIRKKYTSTIQVVLLEYFSNNTWTLATNVTTTLKVDPLDKMREIDKERRLQEKKRGRGDEEK